MLGLIALLLLGLSSAVSLELGNTLTIIGLVLTGIPTALKISEQVLPTDGAGKKGEEQPIPSGAPKRRGRRVAVIVFSAIGALALLSGVLSWAVPSFLIPKPYLYKIQLEYGGYGVSWSPDGKHIAASDFSLLLWNAADGSNRQTSDIDFFHIVWSPDSKYIAGWKGLLDETATVWDVANASVAFTYSNHSSTINAAARSPDGKRIVSASDDGTVQVWNALDGQNASTYHGHHKQVEAVAWSPDGKRIVSASRDQTIQVWDAASGKLIYKLSLVAASGSSSPTAVAWSPDGKSIAVSYRDGLVRILHAADGKAIYTFQGHRDCVNAIAWSPDSMRIASASDDKTVRVWNAFDGGHAFIYTGHKGRVNAVTWSPDGSRIASVSDDKTVQVWLPIN